MNIDFALEELEKNKVTVEQNISLANHSSFKIGGTCRLGIFPQSASELKLAISILSKNQVKSKIIGKGSNLLFSDNGYNGALIFTEKMTKILKLSDNTIYAEAGATLKGIANFACAHGLSGLEFAHGIPGSCGGGVYMNAGAYGGEISQILKYSDCYNIEKDELFRIDNSEHNFSYRHSLFCENDKLIVLGACFQLVAAPVNDIKKLMQENLKKRKEKQPLEYPNGGSTFKRPNNGFAAQMIDECGLKGYCVGGAEVSSKHAGFVINKGGATANDVKELMDIIRSKVYEKFGVVLEAEIQFVE